MSKLDTYMTNPRSAPLRSPLIEAAKFLASAARDFITEKAGPNTVEEAIVEWQAARQAPPTTGGKRETCAGTGRIEREAAEEHITRSTTREEPTP